MKVLLHICCAPCAIYPLKVLESEGFGVLGFFYRQNIHPYQECLRRQETLETYAEMTDLKVIYQENYDIEAFIRNVAFRESRRCDVCYHERLTAAARLAKRSRFDYFSSTLLYSKFQQHDKIKSIAESVAETTGTPFYYYDFRQGWQEGIDASKRLEMYRQQYCGCIYSEKERFFTQRSSKRP